MSMKSADGKVSACLAPRPARAPQRFKLPAGSWDTHAHPIGLPERYPMVAARHFTPPPVSASDFIGMLDAAGHSFGTLVQVSVHGTDNRLLCESLLQYPQRLRGVAVFGPDNTERELAELKKAGVVGARIQTVAGGGIGIEHLDSVTRRCQELGWHLQICLPGHEYPAMVARLSKLPVPLMIDHMGWFDIDKGLKSEEFQAVLHLVKNADCHVKLVGAFRRSKEPAPYRDTMPYARALIEAAPDRLVWGSDWPHVGVYAEDKLPQVGELLDSLHETTSDPAILKKILVETPARFYGLPGGK